MQNIPLQKHNTALCCSGIKQQETLFNIKFVQKQNISSIFA